VRDVRPLRSIPMANAFLDSGADRNELPVLLRAEGKDEDPGGAVSPWCFAGDPFAESAFRMPV
jgi:hypothetical protein